LSFKATVSLQVTNSANAVGGDQLDAPDVTSARRTITASVELE
jgi:hypothetical protein